MAGKTQRAISQEVRIPRVMYDDSRLTPEQDYSRVPLAFAGF